MNYLWCVTFKCFRTYPTQNTSHMFLGSINYKCKNKIGSLTRLDFHSQENR